MKSALILALVALVSSSFAQGGSGPTSRADATVQAVYDRLAREVAERSGNAHDLEAVGRNPMRIVFLVDSSQASEKDYYNEFVRKVASGLLRKIGMAQSAARVSDDARDDVWLFPYQMDLIREAAVKSKRLKSGEGTVQAIMSGVPNARIPQAGETNRGHDSSRARRSLMAELGPAFGPRETVIVQVTPTSANADPDHPDNDQRIKNLDARTGLLDGVDYVVYRDDGRYFQTDAPGRGIAPSDVYIWLYGPARFEVPPKSVAPILHPSPTDGTPAHPAPIGLYLGLAALAVVAAYLAYRLTLKIPVRLGNEVRKVGPMGTVKIMTAGGKGGEDVLLIPDERRGNVGGAVKVGEINLPFFAGGPKVAGAGGYTLSVNNSPKSDIPLSSKPTLARFAKGDQSTTVIELSTKK